MVPLMVVMECFDVLCILLANGSFSFGGICGHANCCLSKRITPVFPPVLVQLVGRQEGHPACKKLEWWGAGMVICLEQGADLHMAQLMPLPLTVSCFSITSVLSWLILWRVG